MWVNSKGDPSHLVVENTIVGHIEGIAAVAAVLSQTRSTTTTEPIDMPYRHGILHGRDLRFDNEMVSAKSFWLFRALCSWGEAYDRQRLARLTLVNPMPVQEPTLRDALNKLKAASDPASWYATFPEAMRTDSRKLRRPLPPSGPFTTIPCLASRRLARELQVIGFDCPPPSRLFGSMSWVMRRGPGGSTYHVEIVGISADETWRVDARFLGTAPHATKQHAEAFLGFVATVPYQGCDTDQARRWVIANIEADAETIIGGARLRVDQYPPMTRLSLRALDHPE